MMRTPLRLAAASVAATTLVVTAAGAIAQPADPAPAAPAAPVAAGTGSSAVDSGSAAAESAVYYIQHGDIIGVLVLLASTPFAILTNSVCDLATLSALRSPCKQPY